MKTYKIITLLSSVVLFSCSFKKPNFSVTTPKGWIRKDTVSSKNEKCVKMHAPIFDTIPQFVENINIYIQHFYSASSYMDGVLAESKKTSRFFEEEGRGTFQTDKFTAKWEQHSVIAKKSTDEFQQKVYFIGDHGNIYMIVCTARKNSIKSLQNTIDEVMNSFVIL